MCSLCTPSLPVDTKGTSAGRASVAFASTASTVASQAGFRAASVGPMPAFAASRSTASVVHHSLVYGQSRSSAACARRFDLVGAVAEPHRPVGRVTQVRARLLDRLRGDLRELGVGGRRQRLVARHRERRGEQVAHDRRRVVVVRGLAVGQLDQRAVAEVALVAEVGERVPRRGRGPRGGRRARAAAGPGRSGRARRYGQRDVLFQQGPWPHHSARRWPRTRASSARRRR